MDGGTDKLDNALVSRLEQLKTMLGGADGIGKLGNHSIKSNTSNQKIDASIEKIQARMLQELNITPTSRTRVEPKPTQSRGESMAQLVNNLLLDSLDSAIADVQNQKNSLRNQLLSTILLRKMPTTLTSAENRREELSNQRDLTLRNREQAEAKLREVKNQKSNNTKPEEGTTELAEPDPGKEIGEAFINLCNEIKKQDLENHIIALDKQLIEIDNAVDEINKFIVAQNKTGEKEKKVERTDKTPSEVKPKIQETSRGTQLLEILAELKDVEVSKREKKLIQQMNFEAATLDLLREDKLWQQLIEPNAKIEREAVEEFLVKYDAVRS